MIETEKYRKILAEGLLLDHFSLLCNIRDNNSILEVPRVQGFINLLTKKGYLQDRVLTDKAKALLEGHLVRKDVEVILPSRVINAGFDYADWVISLHRKCEKRLLEGTGKRQIRDKIDGKPYSFLPNSTDLGMAIHRAVKFYKLSDFPKIEKTILAYIDRCIKANKWFPILGYYIMKNSMSTMVTDMGNIDEEESTDNASITIV